MTRLTLVFLTCLITSTITNAGTLGTIGGGNTSGYLHCEWVETCPIYLSNCHTTEGCYYHKWCCYDTRYPPPSSWDFATCSDPILYCPW